MELSTYLKYNGVMLIDPMNEFHSSCIQFFESRGFLSPKQVQALKNYVFSVEDISRLVKTNTTHVEPVPCKRPTLPGIVPVAVPEPIKVKKTSKKNKKNKRRAQSVIDVDVTDLF